MTHYTIKTHQENVYRKRADRFWFDHDKRYTQRISDLSGDPVGDAFVSDRLHIYWEDIPVGVIWMFKYTRSFSPNVDFILPLDNLTDLEEEFLQVLNDNIREYHSLMLTTDGWVPRKFERMIF